MPHVALKLTGGVNQNRTIALNESAISESQLIRFIPDDRGMSLPQKLGGWVKYFSSSVGSAIRALWAWADTNDIRYLGVGATNYLGAISDNILKDLTPATITNDVSVSIDTVIGSNVVTITDIGSNITSYDSVWIKTQISVGGLVLFGVYQCYAASANTYQIYATDILGDPQNATATVVAGGAVADFETTSGSSIVTVTLADHGLFVANTYTILVPITIGGITLSGNYTVVAVNSTSEFEIQAETAATATAGPTAQNGGDARYVYYIGEGPLPGGTGFGVGGFGEGGFGSGVTPTAGNTGTPITADDWTLDNWGSIFVATKFEGEIYIWNPLQNSNVASIIPTAPPTNTGAFVAMPQRQIIAYGSTFNGIIDHLLVRWTDIEDIYEWIAKPTNQAGSFRIPKGSRIIGALQAPQQSLIWTDVSLWSMQYIGQPYVYSFNEVGTGCGLIGQKACAIMNGMSYWMGRSQFYAYGGGSGVQTIFCPIWDVIFQDIDFTYAQKIRCAANSQFSEVTWYYPTIDSNGEVAKYVKYNVALQQWDFGTLQRTAWINQSVLGSPIGGDASGFIYQHEVSTDADGQPMTSSFQTGYFALSEGNNKVFVDEVWPDMKWGYYDGVQNANVQLTFYVTDFPGTTPVAYGPYTLTQSTQYITPRFRTRLMSIKIESNDIGSFWRLGNMRYRMQPDGKY